MEYKVLKNFRAVFDELVRKADDGEVVKIIKSNGFISFYSPEKSYFYVVAEDTMDKETRNKEDGDGASCRNDDIAM